MAQGHDHKRHERKSAQSQAEEQRSRGAEEQQKGTSMTKQTEKKRVRPNSQKQSKQQPMQPQWQPIERLALIAHHIDGMLESATEQYETLHPRFAHARPKPYVLDNYTVGRVIEVFIVQQNDLWLFDEQLRRWETGDIGETGNLTPTQRTEVTRLVGQMLQLHEVITAILQLAAELKEGTIEKQLAKSDFERGIEALRNL